MLKAIETQWNGYRFRSRTEARWAVFFDALKIQWEYEKEGFDLGNGEYYLPDFWLPQVDMWAEVKGEITPRDLYRCALLYQQSGKGVVILDGVPDFRSYFGYHYGPTYELMNDNGEIAAITDGGYPGKEFYIPVPWEDFIIDAHYLDERRFFTSTGDGEWPKPYRWDPSLYGTDDHTAAVYRARAARFEPRFRYGEREAPIRIPH